MSAAAVADRLLSDRGEFEPAQKWYAQFRADHPDGPWGSAAAAELWLANRTGLPPRPVAVMVFPLTPVTVSPPPRWPKPKPPWRPKPPGQPPQPDPNPPDVPGVVGPACAGPVTSFQDTNATFKPATLTYAG